MLAKLVLTAAVIGIAVVLILRGRAERRGPRRTGRRPAPTPVEALVPCPRCGTYRPAGRSCDCGASPTDRK